MALSRPTTSGGRPGYLDNLYSSRQPHHKNPSLSSTASTTSFNSASSPSEPRAVQLIPRPLSPAVEEEQTDDHASVRSLRLTLSPRNKLRSMLNRRTYPQVKETTVEYQSDGSTTEHNHHRPASRRPSLPRLQTAFSAPPQKTHRRQSKPLPAPPQPQSEELSCKRCYYFHARNCNGYVLGGSHGDACEGCAQSGFFGAP